MKLLIALLLLILSSCLGLRLPAPSPDGSTGDAMFRSDHVIEQVDVRVLESYPMQLHLDVRGYQPDGCEVPVQVEQHREGNEVFVSIYRLMSPAMACPAMIVPYQAVIPLEGGFESGTYTIHVNDFVVTVTV